VLFLNKNSAQKKIIMKFLFDVKRRIKNEIIIVCGVGEKKRELLLLLFINK
jgi:hypothetical protein